MPTTLPWASPGGQHFYFVCPRRSLALATVLHNSESTSVTPPRPDDLTSLELKSRYVDVLQYFLNLPTTDPQLQKFNEQYTLEISLLLQRLPSLNLNRCYVSTSNILKAGNGVKVYSPLEIFP
ncbi:hypothetical protein TL16_g02624 [Triparma laevis f. inornata]|uniref:Uncharacterized protein n=2 Tax=Triparma laevis TaxID=1534972 RepID=A0A9W6ZCN8_9STRA|nr:hypothetical protein TrLO_g14409 [Triparma laevis f. longispina]GMH58507.1 hypothetical protein TL16_g02624 [Triparma laevis f. inornata]